MLLDFNSDKPIYIQISEAIEDDILKDIYKEEEQVISTTELSVSLKINPATARKGLNLLVDDGIIYKKRGVGMFVCDGAKDKILEKRKKSFYDNFISSLLEEASKLKISKEEIIKMIEGGN
ncbi:GntR family transcriptional regulator [Sporosalibacterium faouarense]|uniref:GntR family transcriptional regulator n=1 Tax=Sporosalibacterium faouarense TaxID=516123 RepID=UPI00192B94E3